MGVKYYLLRMVIAVRRAVVFNYKSHFFPNIIKAINRYNSLFPDRAFTVDSYDASKVSSESSAGRADLIMHSGGDGRPVREDTAGIPKFYICHSHQWKAKKEGGSIVRLNETVKGVKTIDVSEDDEILGKRGPLAIMAYHRLAVLESPSRAKILATSSIIDPDGKRTEIIEALRYADRSFSIQGHPEEGTAEHLLFNFFNSNGGAA